MKNNSYEYDVALSFAGEDRAYVEEVANSLNNRGVKVFYDLFEEANLWGKNLYEYLSEIYQSKIVDQSRESFYASQSISRKPRVYFAGKI